MRRVDAEFSAVELPPGRVIEVVQRALGDQDVALRVDVRRHPEEDVLVVVDVHVLVHDHDRLRQREHPESPERVHHLLRMTGEGLADRDDHAVVEGARDRKVVVDDLGQRHPDRRKEDPLGCLSEPGVLRRRLPDDDRRIDRVAPHRQRRDAEDRELLGVRVVAGVVAERAFDADVVTRDRPLEDDLGVRRDFQVHGLAADELHRLAAQEAGEHELVDVVWERRARGVRRHGIEPDRDGYRDPPVLGREEIGPPVLVHLPVHVGGACIDHLHPVHAEVADARLRVLRDDRGKRDEGGRILRPAALDRKPAEVHIVALEHDLLARSLRDGLRHGVGDRLQLQEASHLLHETLRRLHVEHLAQLRRRVVELLDAQGEAHAPFGSELVDEERMRRSLRMLEEERRSSGLDDAVGDLRDLEIRIDLGRDASELALALEERDPLPEIGERRHRGQSMVASAAAARSAAQRSPTSSASAFDRSIKSRASPGAPSPLANSPRVRSNAATYDLGTPPLATASVAESRSRFAAWQSPSVFAARARTSRAQDKRSGLSISYARSTLSSASTRAR